MTDYIKQGDCLELMKEIPSGSVDMILCDLPYGVTNNKWDKQIDLNKLWFEYKRVIKDKGTICLFGQGKFFADLINSNRSWYRYDLVWDKVFITGFLNANRMPLRRHEQIGVFYKKLPTYNPQFTLSDKPVSGKPFSVESKSQVNHNYGRFIRRGCKSAGKWERYPTSILQYPRPNFSNVIHPTEKPAKLLEYLIKTYTQEGEIVLDNCMGCGSSIVACINTNRRYIGFELEQEYFDIAKERIEKVKAEL